MSDRVLLWRLIANNILNVWQSGRRNTHKIHLVDALEKRLFPEYDGVAVTFQRWDRRTPQGDIVYVETAIEPG